MAVFRGVGIRPALDKTKGVLLPANGGRHSTAVPPVIQGHLPSDMRTHHASYVPTETDIPPEREAGPLSTCDRIMTVPNRESLGESSQLNGELELRQVRVMEHSPAPPLSLTKSDRTTLGLETRVLCHETGA